MGTQEDLQLKTEKESEGNKLFEQNAPRGLRKFHEEDVQDKKFISMSVKEEEFGIKIELEAVPYTEESFVEPEFVLPEEMGVMVGNEEKLSTVANEEGHKLNLSKSPAFICITCSYQTNQKSKMNRHILTHMPKTIECPHCHYMTNNEQHLNKHQLVHVPDKIATLYNCPKCPYKSKRKNDLTQHLLRHKKPEEITWYKCPDCTYKTKRKWDLMHRHMSIHKKDQ